MPAVHGAVALRRQGLSSLGRRLSASRGEATSRRVVYENATSRSVCNLSSDSLDCHSFVIRLICITGFAAGGAAMSGTGGLEGSNGETVMQSDGAAIATGQEALEKSAARAELGKTNRDAGEVLGRTIEDLKLAAQGPRASSASSTLQSVSPQVAADQVPGADAGITSLMITASTVGAAARMSPIPQ